MKKRLMTLAVALLVCIATFAVDETTSDGGRKKINIGTIKPPKPARMIDEPVAEYNTVTGTLTITLDAVSYSEYTIILSSGYANYNAAGKSFNIPKGSTMQMNCGTIK